MGLICWQVELVLSPRSMRKRSMAPYASRWSPFMCEAGKVRYPPKNHPLANMRAWYMYEPDFFVARICTMDP